MSFFLSRRERNLWIMGAFIQAAIFLTLSLATPTFLITPILVGVAITLISFRGKLNRTRIGMMISVTAVYWMASIRILALEEGSHLFEYSLVAALIFQP